jgi:hypothetical protein
MDLKEGFPNDHSDFLVDKMKKSLKIQREVTTIRKSKKKDSQHNGQKKKYKWTNNDLQNLHIKL